MATVVHVAERRFAVVLPNVRDARLHTAAVVMTIHVLGQVALGFAVSVPQIVAAIATLVGSPEDPESRRVLGLRVTGVFLVLCVLLSLFFLPTWTGMEIPRWYLNLHFWFPTWI